ncbi:MAG: rhomboid family intramembrane serine protease [Acidobacteriota bacterium]|nr:rhomboid family intramembrane serine protease [Acidobacteriota bacterium]
MSAYFFGGPATRTVKSLVVANAAVYLAQLAFHHLLGSSLLEEELGLRPDIVTSEYALWRFATYMFLHGNPFHLLFNMLPLFMFGNELVRYWGPRRFLAYYFVTGVGAGVCSWAVSMHSGNTVIGASGAVYGLLLAYGMSWPNRVVYLNFLLPVKVKWLVVIMGAVAFLSSITESDPGVANIAHLGGMVVGYVYLKGRDWGDRYRAFNEQRRREQLKRRFEVYYGDVRRKVEHGRGDGNDTIH